MSDSELSDGIDELQELMAEYDAKAENKDEENNVNEEQKVEENKIVLAKKPKRNRNMEVPMDKVIFGDKEGLIKKLTKAVGEDDSDDSDNERPGADEVQRKAPKRKPAWIDPDDEKIQLGEVKRETKHTGPLDHLRMDKSYKEYLTSRFTRIVAQPKWANLDRKKKSEEDSDDEALLHTVGFLAKPSSSAISANHIQYKRLKDVNRATYSEGPISAVCFHPTSTAALVCGELGIATIYAIDGRDNAKLHSIGFPTFPIKCARITPCGTKAIFSSNKRTYYSYDLLTAQESRHVVPKDITTCRNFELSHCGRYLVFSGRFGELHLFDAKSKELIHTFKQEDQVAGIKFTSDSRRIITSSKSSVVNIFDMRSQRLEHSFNDDGCILGCSLDLAPNQRLLATGSREGVVNVYDFDKVFSSKNPRPETTKLNLTTAITSVRFNHTSELLGMCSKEVLGAVKLIHFPTGTVYANFPGFNSNVGKVRTIEFSPSSGYLAMGNCNREVPLFRLKHFKNY